jgi:hypothetical protein
VFDLVVECLRRALLHHRAVTADDCGPTLCGLANGKSAISSLPPQGPRSVDGYLNLPPCLPRRARASPSARRS